MRKINQTTAREIHESGERPADAAARLGVPVDEVKHALKKYGFSRFGLAISYPVAVKISQGYTTMREWADKLGVTVGQVRYALKWYGLNRGGPVKPCVTLEQAEQAARSTTPLTVWAKKFGVTRDQLHQTVARYGLRNIYCKELDHLRVPIETVAHLPPAQAARALGVTMSTYLRAKEAQKDGSNSIR